MRHGKQSRRIRGSCSSLTISLQSAVTGPTGHALASIDDGHGPTNSGGTTDGVTTAGVTVPAMNVAAHFSVPEMVSTNVPSDVDNLLAGDSNRDSSHPLAGRNNNLIRDLQFQIGYTQILDAVTQGQAGWTQGIVNASGIQAPSQSFGNSRDANLSLIGNWHEVEAPAAYAGLGVFGFAGPTAHGGITKGQGFAANSERSRSTTPLLTNRFANIDPSMNDELLSREAILRRIGFGEFGFTFGDYIGNFRTSPATFADTLETNISVDDPPPPIIPVVLESNFDIDNDQTRDKRCGWNDFGNTETYIDAGGGGAGGGGATRNPHCTPYPTPTPTITPTPTPTPTPTDTPETTNPTPPTTVTTVTTQTTEPPDGGTGDEPTLVMRQGRGIFCYNLSPGNLFEHFPAPGDRIYGAGLRLTPRAIAGRLSDITDTEPSIDNAMHFRIVGFTGEYNFTPEATQHMTWNFRDITSDTTNGGIAWAATGGFGTTDSDLGISAGFTINIPVDLDNPITVNMTELVQDAVDNHDGFLRFMLMKEPDSSASDLGAVQFYGWCGRDTKSGRQDFEPDLFVRYMPVGSTNGSGAASGVDMGPATVEGATHPGEKFIRRDARRRHEFYPPKRQIPR